MHSKIYLSPDDCVDSLHWLSANLVFCKVGKQRYKLVDFIKGKSLFEDFFEMDIESQNFKSEQD